MKPDKNRFESLRQTTVENKKPTAEKQTEKREINPAERVVVCFEQGTDPKTGLPGLKGRTLFLPEEKTGAIKLAFIDRKSKTKPQAGETWICRITNETQPENKRKGCFFVEPVDKTEWHFEETTDPNSGLTEYSLVCSNEPRLGNYYAGKELIAELEKKNSSTKETKESDKKMEEYWRNYNPSDFIKVYGKPDETEIDEYGTVTLKYKTKTGEKIFRTFPDQLEKAYGAKPTGKWQRKNDGDREKILMEKEINTISGATFEVVIGEITNGLPFLFDVETFLEFSEEIKNSIITELSAETKGPELYAEKYFSQEETKDKEMLDSTIRSVTRLRSPGECLIIHSSYEGDIDYPESDDGVLPAGSYRGIIDEYNLYVGAKKIKMDCHGRTYVGGRYFSIHESQKDLDPEKIRTELIQRNMEEIYDCIASYQNKYFVNDILQSKNPQDITEKTVVSKYCRLFFIHGDKKEWVAAYEKRLKELADAKLSAVISEIEEKVENAHQEYKKHQEACENYDKVYASYLKYIKSIPRTYLDILREIENNLPSGYAQADDTTQSLISATKKIEDGMEILKLRLSIEEEKRKEKIVPDKELEKIMEKEGDPAPWFVYAENRDSLIKEMEKLGCKYGTGASTRVADKWKLLPGTKSLVGIKLETHYKREKKGFKNSTGLQLLSSDIDPEFMISGMSHETTLYAIVEDPNWSVMWEEYEYDKKRDENVLRYRCFANAKGVTRVSFWSEGSTLESKNWQGEDTTAETKMEMSGVSKTHEKNKTTEPVKNTIKTDEDKKEAETNKEEIIFIDTGKREFKCPLCNTYAKMTKDDYVKYNNNEEVKISCVNNHQGIARK